MCVLLLVAAVTLATRGAHAQAPHKFGAAIWRAVVTAPTTKAFRAALQDLGNYTSLLSDPIDTSKLCPAVMCVRGRARGVARERGSTANDCSPIAIHLAQSAALLF